MRFVRVSVLALLLALLALPVSAPTQIGGGGVSGVRAPFTAGGQTFNPGGVLYWENPVIANGANQNWVSTTAYSVPAGLLATNGDQLIVEVDWTLGNAAENRSYLCNIGYTAYDNTNATPFTGGFNFLSNTTAATSTGIRTRARVTRLGATSSSFVSLSEVNASGQSTVYGTSSQVTWANANNLLCVGRDSAASNATQITIQELRVLWSPR